MHNVEPYQIELAKRFAELEKELAEVKALAQAVVDHNIHVKLMKREPDEIESYGVNGRKLWALKKRLEGE